MAQCSPTFATGAVAETAASAAATRSATSLASSESSSASGTGTATSWLGYAATNDEIGRPSGLTTLSSAQSKAYSPELIVMPRVFDARLEVRDRDAVAGDAEQVDAPIGPQVVRDEFQFGVVAWRGREARSRCA